MREIRTEVWMLKVFKWIAVFFSFVVFSCAHAAVDYVSKQNVDFIHYQAELEPNFTEQSVKGEVEITFKPEIAQLSDLSFIAQYKKVNSVELEGKPVNFSIKNDLLTVSFSKALQQGKSYQLSVNYSVAPKRGMKFFDDHLFTVYHTKNWLVAHTNISDKASLELSLIHEPQLTAVSVGSQISSRQLENGKQVSTWQQSTPIPIYTFGFALGDFERLSFGKGSKQIDVLFRKGTYTKLTKAKVENAFKNALDMMIFFEQKSGIEFKASPYQYLVVDGYMAQEVDGYSLVGEKFVHTLLNNKFENWFIAHELAHEWWGNNITAANFSHFWLNEGMVQFLVAAYKEHLFGKQAYYDEIDVAIRRVAKAAKEKRVAPVAFKTEIAENEINRTMAYSKGALVFYMLRKELGDELFWRAIKQYSQTHYYGSVTTQDLKAAIEKVTQRDLTEFFETWVYGTAIPEISH